MKTFEFSYPWTERKEWRLPDDELMMQGQFPILDEQIDFVLEAIISSPNFCEDSAPFKTCVQAGGAFGMYPLRLSYYFEKVWTFEPLLENLQCLKMNIDSTKANITVTPYALWHEKAMLFMNYSKPVKNSYGAHHVSQTPTGLEDVPAYPLDDWGLEDVDLIWLDVEGAEKHVLRGAAHTITQNMPVVVIEQHKRLPQHAKLGVTLDGASHWLLKNFDYKLFGRTHGDVVYIPRTNNESR